MTAYLFSSHAWLHIEKHHFVLLRLNASFLTYSLNRLCFLRACLSIKTRLNLQPWSPPARPCHVILVSCVVAPNHNTHGTNDTWSETKRTASRISTELYSSVLLLLLLLPLPLQLLQGITGGDGRLFTIYLPASLPVCYQRGGWIVHDNQCAASTPDIENRALFYQQLPSTIRAVR